MGCIESIKIILIFAENVIKLIIARTLKKIQSSEIEHLRLTEYEAISVCVSDLSFTFYSVYNILSHNLCISALKNIMRPNYLLKLSSLILKAK